MASPDPPAQKEHRRISPRNYTDEEIVFVLDQASKAFSIKEIIGLHGQRFEGRTLKHSQVKYIRDTYGKDPAWGVSRIVGRAIDGHPAPAQGSQGPSAALGQNSETGNGFGQHSRLPSLKPEPTANNGFNPNGYQVQDLVTRAPITPDNRTLFRNPFGEDTQSSETLGRSDQTFSGGDNRSPGQLMNPVGKFGGDFCMSSPSPAPSGMARGNQGQLPDQGPGPFNGASLNAGNTPDPMPHTPVPHTPVPQMQAISPRNMDNLFNLSGAGQQPTNTGAVADSLTGWPVPSGNADQPNSGAAGPPPAASYDNIFGLPDPQPEWSQQPLPDLSNFDFGLDQAPSLNPPHQNPDQDISALSGPGTWYEGAHDDCDLDARHRHCPDGGVYFPTAAGAADMVRRAKESLPLRHFEELGERLRESTECLRRVETRMNLAERASFGLVQGTGQAVMLLDIGGGGDGMWDLPDWLGGDEVGPGPGGNDGTNGAGGPWQGQ